MVLTFDIDDKTRVIILHQDAEMKPTRIHKITQVPLSTVQDWIKKLDQGIDIREHRGQGREPSIDIPMKKKVVRAVRKDPNAASTRKLSSQFEISKTSIHNILVESQYKYKTVFHQVQLTTKEEENRMIYCKDMIKTFENKIDKTFFSDETGISLSEAWRKKMWVGPKQKVVVDDPRVDIRINCWGAISRRGATSLHLYKGHLNAFLYEQILKAHVNEMRNIYPRGFYFQQDKLSSHVAVKNWIVGQGLRLLDFPTYSPDLAPIERLWGLLKQAVAADGPHE